MTQPAYKKTHLRILNFYKNYIGMSLSRAISAGGHNFHISLPTNVVFNQYATILDPIFIDITVNKKEYITIELPKQWVAICVKPLITPLNLHDIQPIILMNILEIAFSHILQALEEEKGLFVEFSFHAGQPPKNLMKTQLQLLDAQTQEPYRATIYGGMQNIEDFLDKIFLGATPEPHLKPSTSLSIVSAVKQISLCKLQLLKRGEIILIMTQRHLVSQPLVIIGQKLVVQASIVANQLKVETDPELLSQNQELNMNQGDAPPPMPTEIPAGVSTEISGDAPDTPQAPQDIATQTASLSDMRVPVTFELASMDIPFETLKKIKKGEVIELHKPIDENISVIANGKVIALGEVVQVGQNFGVIIKEIL